MWCFQASIVLLLPFVAWHPIFLYIACMFDIVPIGLAFFLGILFSWFRLPPLLGFLAAGFILRDFWSEGKETLQAFSDFGITILLFCIGLKIQVFSLLKKEVLFPALTHFFIIFSFYVLSLHLLPNTLSINQITLIGFALTFSSTVYVVKLLEDRGDLKAHYGSIAIGILVVQDLIAVAFMAFASNQIPSTWSFLLLIVLWPISIFIKLLLTWIERGELLVLFGIVIAMSGAFLFSQFNIKGDLGALLFGFLLANHPRSSELNKKLLSLKNFFLLGFFLSIGMYAPTTWNDILIAAILCLSLPLKSILYYFLFNQLGLRSRTSFLGAWSLQNFSEFGLIVMAFFVSSGWLPANWISILALTVSFSFVWSALLNRQPEKLYNRFKTSLLKKEKSKFHPFESPILLKDTNLLIFGMGRVGRGAYLNLKQDQKWHPLGFDFNLDVIANLKKQGLKVKLGDASNPDFWERLQIDSKKINAVLLTMPLVSQNIKACRALREKGYTGFIASVAKFDDETAILQEAGVDKVFNLYAEAGVGFSESTIQNLNLL